MFCTNCLEAKLTPTIQVVNGVIVVNPGPLSKRKGAGAFAQASIYPRKVTDQEREAEASEGARVGHDLYNRARIDIVKV